MQKHRGEDGQQRGCRTEDWSSRKQPDFEAWHDAELREQPIELAATLQADLPLEKINQQVDGNQEIRYEGRAEDGLVVAERKHTGSGTVVDLNFLMFRWSTAACCAG